MKYLILIALFLAVIWGVRKSRITRSDAKPPVARDPERMFTCALCGVNQALNEGVLSRGRYFCCIAHQRESDSQDD